jgi:hypothetical protein
MTRGFHLVRPARGLLMAAVPLACIGLAGQHIGASPAVDAPPVAIRLFQKDLAPPSGHGAHAALYMVLDEATPLRPARSGRVAFQPDPGRISPDAPPAHHRTLFF